MFSNKKTQINRTSKLKENQKKAGRSSTPTHAQAPKPARISQSQSKTLTSTQVIPPNPINTLAPILEQLQIEKPYYLGKGNNHEIIKLILSRRKGWGQVASNHDFVYFRWSQSIYSFKYHLMGKECYCFNHFEYHRELSNKQRLVQNMINFCEANKINVYSFIPVSFIIDLNTGEEDLALHAFVKFFNRNYPDDSSASRRYQSMILPRSKYTGYFTAQQLNKRSQGNFYCKPYFSKSFMDNDTKSYLWILKPTFLNRGRGVVLFKELDEAEKLIWKYYEGQGLEEYGDKHFPQNQKPIERIQQVKDVLESQEFAEQMQGEIDKPHVKNNTSIYVSQKIKEEAPNLKKTESEKQEKKQNEEAFSSNNMLASTQPSNIVGKQGQTQRCMSFIIQKYIERPMLIEGKKFDIRCWVLLTQNLQVYSFEQAYLRFSSQLYSTKDNHMNPFIHLTNNSVQKYCNQYDKSSGNQVALSQIVNYLPAEKSASIYNSIKKKINEIIWLSMCSVRRKINVNSRKDCFELFGYDFMIDYEYRVWLIQVNTNPAIEESGPLLRMLLPRMIDDMFKLTIDKIFNNQMKPDLAPLKVDGVNDEDNMWQFLGDLKQGANERNGRRLTFARR